MDDMYGSQVDGGWLVHCGVPKAPIQIRYVS